MSFSWSPAAATYGVLFADAPTTPLNQIADFLSNDMAYYGVVLGGHHYVDFSSVNEATDGTGAPFFGTMNSGQMLCFNGTDACRNQYTAGPANVLQDVSSNGIVFDEVAVANGVNHIRVTNAATGGTAGLSAIGSDANVNLSISAQGTGSITVPSQTYFGSLLSINQGQNLSFNGVSNNIYATYASNLWKLNMNGSTFTVDLSAAIHANNTSGAQGTNTLAATVFSGNLTASLAASPPSGTKGGNVCYDTNKVLYGC